MRRLIDFVSLKLISPFNWGRIKFLLTGREFNLLPEDREHARRLMAHAPYLWVSRRRTHFTSYLISTADFLLALKTWVNSKFKGKRPRWGYWTHAFISGTDFKVIEAVACGVQEAYFDRVFDCDSIACLVPSFSNDEEWAEVSKLVIELAHKQIGKKYDTIFNIADDSELSCIELVRVALMAVPQYALKFKDFEEMIQLYKNVTPQMLFESKSFRVVWEVRR